VYDARVTGDPTGQPLTPETLLKQLGKPYEPLVERFAPRHAELLNALTGEVPVRLQAEPVGEARYLVSLCARDCVGLLAVVAGLFAAHRIDIRNGDVFSLPASGGAGAAGRDGRVLDLFEVVTPQTVYSDFWRRFEAELSELIGLLESGESDAAIERLTLGVSGAAAAEKADDDPLYPVAVSVDNERSGEFTELRIQSIDSPAVLFECAYALTLLDVDIGRVEIRTLYGEVRDTFWVTDVKGRRIDDEERIHELRVATALIQQFSHLLPRSANPAQALQQFSSFTSEMLKRPDWTAALEPLGSGDVMRTLGNKVAARAVAVKAGVPVVPATGALPDDIEGAKKMAREPLPGRLRRAAARGREDARGAARRAGPGPRRGGGGAARRGPEPLQGPRDVPHRPAAHHRPHRHGRLLA